MLYPRYPFLDTKHCFEHHPFEITSPQPLLLLERERNDMLLLLLMLIDYFWMKGLS